MGVINLLKLDKMKNCINSVSNFQFHAKFSLSEDHFQEDCERFIIKMF